MCSNTSTLSSSGRGGGGSGGDNEGGGGGGYGGGDSIYSKKQIRRSQQKVPKRGPGVAELEKILREQENNNKNTTTTTTNLVSPLMSSSSSNYRSLQSSNSNLLPVTSTVSISPSPSPSPSPNPNILKHFNGRRMWNNSNCELELNGTSRFQFSALPLTGQLFHPSSSSSSSSNNLMQTTTQHSGPSTKNLFPHSGSGSSSSSSSSLTTLSGGTCSTHGREPPSNQTSYRHTSTLWPEEDKMVGEKRARAFAMEIPPVPPFRYHLPTFSAQMNSRLETPFSCDTRSTLFNLEPPDHTISREMRQTTCLEPNNKKVHTEHGESERNFLIYPSPTIPPSLIHTPNIFNPFSNFQENNGDLQHNLAFSTHHHNQGGSSITKKPFYTFLPPRDKLGIAEGLNTERIETRGDTIDLDLRL